MRRITLVLLALVLAAAVGIPAAGAAPTRPAGTTAPRTTSMSAFCRSTDRFVRFLAHAPDPRKLATAKGRRVLKDLRADAPAEISEATGTVVGSFGYLGRHGAHSLSKKRDAKTADAPLRAAVFAASHCRQTAVRQLAQGLVQRRMAQAEAANPAGTSTSTTTAPR